MERLWINIYTHSKEVIPDYMICSGEDKLHNPFVPT